MTQLGVPHRPQTFTWPSWSAPLSHPLSDGGHFPVEERLDVRPHLVGFCPRERLQHSFTPGGRMEMARRRALEGQLTPK